MSKDSIIFGSVVGIYFALKYIYPTKPPQKPKKPQMKYPKMYNNLARILNKKKKKIKKDQRLLKLRTRNTFPNPKGSGIPRHLFNVIYDYSIEKHYLIVELECELSCETTTCKNCGLTSFSEWFDGLKTTNSKFRIEPFTQTQVDVYWGDDDNQTLVYCQGCRHLMRTH
jgi:hypothetical protein